MFAHKHTHTFYTHICVTICSNIKKINKKIYPKEEHKSIKLIVVVRREKEDKFALSATQQC